MELLVHHMDAVINYMQIWLLMHTAKKLQESGLYLTEQTFAFKLMFTTLLSCLMDQILTC